MQLYYNKICRVTVTCNNSIVLVSPLEKNTSIYLTGSPFACWKHVRRNCQIKLLSPYLIITFNPSGLNGEVSVAGGERWMGGKIPQLKGFSIKVI